MVLLIKPKLDRSPNNTLVRTGDTALSKVEQVEFATPLLRKTLMDGTIHLSYVMPTTYDPPVIKDSGAARLGIQGQKHSNDVMPGVFRAPEVITGMEWDFR